MHFVKILSCTKFKIAEHGRQMAHKHKSQIIKVTEKKQSLHGFHRRVAGQDGRQSKPFIPMNCYGDVRSNVLLNTFGFKFHSENSPSI